MAGKTGIFIHEITEKHIWVTYYHDGKQIYKQPIAQTFRDHLDSTLQKDTESGDVAKGFQPEVAFEKLKLSKHLEKELKIA